MQYGIARFIATGTQKNSPQPDIETSLRINYKIVTFNAEKLFTNKALNRDV